MGLGSSKMENLKEQKNYLKEWYNKTAEQYDSWDTEGKLDAEFEGIRELLNIKKGEKVLDVATGTGIYLILAAKRGAICYGVDITPNILEVAKKKVKSLKLKNVKELKIADADNLPYDRNSFDWITCIGMLEYYPIEHAQKILIEFKRILKENGKILIDFPDITNPEAQAFKSKSEAVNTKVYLYNFGEIDKILKGLGLRIVKKQIKRIEIQLLLEKGIEE